MLDKIKELLSNWKVTVALVGGALVVGTTFGTCTVEPNVDAVEEAVEEVVESIGEESSIETISGDGNTTEATEATETTEAVNTTETSSTK